VQLNSLIFARRMAGIEWHGNQAPDLRANFPLETDTKDETARKLATWERIIRRVTWEELDDEAGSMTRVE
jgi:hypothetical protein